MKIVMTKVMMMMIASICGVLTANMALFQRFPCINSLNPRKNSLRQVVL